MRLTGWSLSRICRIEPCNSVEYRVRRERGVTELIADRLAVAAGLHPSLVWSDWLSDLEVECAHPDCPNMFVRHPKGPHRKFCSHRCRRRFNEASARERGLPSAERKRATRRRYYEEHGDYERARQRRYDRNRRSSATASQDSEKVAS